MKEDKINTTLFWIGDHALNIYLESNMDILNLYNHQIILYNRRNSVYVNKLFNEPITYLNEFYPKINLKYSLSELNVPMFELLNNRIGKLKCKEILFIGDTAELLFQTIINLGVKSKHNYEIDQLDSIGFVPMLLDDGLEISQLNLNQFDALFLSELMPFEEELKEAISYRDQGMKGFTNAYRCVSQELEINDFLWHYFENPKGVEKRTTKIK